MSASPRVSVIIPCYNAEAFIRETIQSVLEQTFTDFELIVLNDGSKDRSEALIRAFPDPRVSLVNKRNTGVADTRNQGIGIAKGEFVAFLDADDLYGPENLAAKVTFLDQNPDFGLVHSEVYDLHTSGERHTRGLTGCQGSVLHPLLEFKTMVNSPSSVLVRKDLLSEVGGFDTRLSTSADRDLWIRLAAKTKFGYLPDPLVTYRIHPGQMHHNIDAMESDLKEIYSKLRGKDYFASRSHYHQCRAHVERVIGASYFWHTRQYHKCAKHLILSGVHGTLRFLY